MNQLIEYHQGLASTLCHEAALLYDQAFGLKVSRAIPNRQKRIALFEQAFDTPFAFSAIAQGKLVGLAGFQTDTGSFTSGLHQELLQSHLGYWGGRWADRVLSWYERESTQGILAIDGIAVHKDWRGLGIGTMLLNQLKHYAEQQALHTLQLNVIDTNHAAQRLYERYGFVATHTQSLAYYRRWLLGFDAATTMEFSLERSSTLQTCFVI